MAVGRIYSCARCHITVIAYSDHTKSVCEWATGDPHNCEIADLAWIDALAEDALNGDPDATAHLADAVDAWLAR